LSSEATDLDLVSGISTGDRDALAALYDRYAAIMLGVGTRMLGERREAEDVLHDVFLEVWRRAADYDGGRGTVRTWLLVRMRSRSLDRRRRARRNVAVDLTPRVSDSDPSRAPDLSRVLAALASLPPEQRKVIELGYFAGLSSSEIADRVAAPVGTVKSRVAAALAKLRAGMAVGGVR
jgi:RNA polymerase sigma-70 factor (ECF subfamily)